LHWGDAEYFSYRRQGTVRHGRVTFGERDRYLLPVHFEFRLPYSKFLV
jgi:hypothetical protein